MNKRNDKKARMAAILSDTNAPVVKPVSRVTEEVSPISPIGLMKSLARTTSPSGAGSMAVKAIPASACEPSFANDRQLEDYDEELSNLVQSIKSQGQLVPILVRPHPTEDGQFQIAYGHRRVKACKDLGFAVRAIVKNLNDEELAIAQGKENQERKNTSFIQRALWVASLDKRGLTRKVIADAAGGGDLTTISKLKKIIYAIPYEFIAKIGHAPKIGRTKWERLAKGFENPRAEKRVRLKINTLSGTWPQIDSDKRFDIVLEAAVREERSISTLKIQVKDSGENNVAEIVNSASGTKIVSKGKEGKVFVDWISLQMDLLMHQYEESKKGSSS